MLFFCFLHPVSTFGKLIAPRHAVLPGDAWDAERLKGMALAQRAFVASVMLLVKSIVLVGRGTAGAAADSMRQRFGAPQTLPRHCSHANALRCLGLRARLCGGAPSAEAAESTWARRLAEWEGEDTQYMHMEGRQESGGSAGEAEEHAADSPTPPPALARGGISAVSASDASLHAMEDETAAHSDAGAVASASSPAGGPSVHPVDAALERVRRQSVIQELVGMGADFRRAEVAADSCPGAPAESALQWLMQHVDDHHLFEGPARHSPAPSPLGYGGLSGGRTAQSSRGGRGLLSRVKDYVGDLLLGGRVGGKKRRRGHASGAEGGGAGGGTKHPCRLRQRSFCIRQ